MNLKLICKLQMRSPEYTGLDDMWEKRIAPLGMSTRQIGNALGTSDWTVRQDMKESARNLADEPRRGQSIGTSTLMFQMENQTQQQVADKLGVTQRTVSNDLNRNFSNEESPSTITNSRGQNRRYPEDSEQRR